jgi:hypothetical protein
MKIENTKCHYCSLAALYNQPDKDTGEVVSVCQKHFRMSASS